MSKGKIKGLYTIKKKIFGENWKVFGVSIFGGS